MRLFRPALRTCVAATGVAAALLLASPASAHVTVSTPDAAPGDFGKVVFRVPTESETASTTKLSVTLPKDTPFAFVSTQAKPGWKVSMKKTKHAKPVRVGDFNVTKTVRTVTWTATKGHGIAPGEFDEFALSVGPFPKDPGDTITFPADQTYSDGSTVAWDEPTPKSGKEPEHPAPSITLGRGDGDTASASKASSASEASTSQPDGTSATTVVALVLAALALVVSLAAAALAASVRRGRG